MLVRLLAKMTVIVRIICKMDVLKKDFFDEWQGVFYMLQMLCLANFFKGTLKQI